jgi:hypothetical protein
MEEATRTPKQALVLAADFGFYSAGSNDAFYPTKLYWPSHYGFGIPIWAPGLPHPPAKGQ